MQVQSIKKLIFCPLNTLHSSLCLSDCSGSIDKTEFSDFKVFSVCPYYAVPMYHPPDCIQKKLKAGEFRKNYDGPWSVSYDRSKNRYIFSRKSGLNRGHLEGLESFRVAIDDGVGGKWVWH